MTQSWTFAGTWPNPPQWFDGADGPMHFIDVGPRDGRVIVPDHLGFGRSDKPDRPGLYAIARDVARLEALLESLDLANVTLVLHDWGGPIALAWAGRHPRPRARATSAAPLPDARDRRAVRARPARDPAYQAPHPTRASRAAILAFAREFPAGPTGEVADLLAAFRSDFPAAAVLEIPHAGHFVQEDAHEIVVPALLAVLGEALSAGSPAAERPRGHWTSWDLSRPA